MKSEQGVPLAGSGREKYDYFGAPQKLQLLDINGRVVAHLRIEAEAHQLTCTREVEESGTKLISAVLSFLRSGIPSPQPLDGGVVEDFKSGESFTYDNGCWF